MTTNRIAALVIAGIFALTGCANADDPEQMTTRCDGDDKIFILDDPNQGSELFVVPGHPECTGGR